MKKEESIDNVAKTETVQTAGTPVTDEEAEAVNGGASLFEFLCGEGEVQKAFSEGDGGRKRMTDLVSDISNVLDKR